MLSIIIPILSISYIIADIFFQEQAFQNNESFTIKIQSKSTPFLNKFFSFTAIIGHSLLIFLLIFLFYMFSHNKVRALVIFTQMLLDSFLMTTMKLIYADPRPYMVFSSISAKKCNIEFGNPSGHAISSLVGFTLLQYELQQRVNNWLKFSSFLNFVKIILWILTGILIFAVGFGRVYLGVHSYNQVLLGWAYGVFMLWFYFFFLKEKLEEILIKLAENNRSLQYINKVKLTIFVLLIIAIGLPIILYEIRKNYYVVPVEWIENFTKKCGNSYDNRKFLYRKCFTDSGIIAAPIGIFLGAVLNKFGSYDLNGKGENLTILLHIKRIFIMVIVLACIYIPFKLIPKGNIIYAIYLFEFLIPNFFMGLSFCLCIPFLYKKFGIQSDVDYLKYEDVEKIDQSETMLVYYNINKNIENV